MSHCSEKRGRRRKNQPSTCQRGRTVRATWRTSRCSFLVGRSVQTVSTIEALANGNRETDIPLTTVMQRRVTYVLQKSANSNTCPSVLVSSTCLYACVYGCLSLSLSVLCLVCFPCFPVVLMRIDVYDFVNQLKSLCERFHNDDCLHEV